MNSNFINPQFASSLVDQYGNPLTYPPTLSDCTGTLDTSRLTGTWDMSQMTGNLTTDRLSGLVSIAGGALALIIEIGLKKTFFQLLHQLH